MSKKSEKENSKGFTVLKKESQESLLDQDRMSEGYQQLKKEREMKEKMDQKNMGK